MRDASQEISKTLQNLCKYISWYRHIISNYERPTNPQFAFVSPVQSSGIALSLILPAAVVLEIVLPYIQLLLII